MVKRLRSRQQQPRPRRSSRSSSQTEEVQGEEELPSWLEKLVLSEEEDEDSLLSELFSQEKQRTTMREELAAFDESLVEPAVDIDSSAQTVSKPLEDPEDMRSQVRPQVVSLTKNQREQKRRALLLPEIREMVDDREKLRQLIFYREVLGPPRALNPFRTGRHF